MSSKSKTPSSATAVLSLKKTMHPRTSSFNKPGPELLEAASKQAGGTNKKPASPKRTAFKARPKPASKKVDITSTSKKEKPQYDKVAIKKFDDMLDGDLSDLPPLPKSMVKIFLSSTFSDMRAERNILAREVYPRLRAYCASEDLDFQVVDMRWGVTEDSQNDHSVEKLCLLEVKNCQKASRGPNFVVLSGNRYGFRPIPIEIDVAEFEMLRAEATLLNLKDKGLLDEWYKLDTNSLPPMYILQPIRSKFTFFADFSPACDEPRKKDTADWWKCFASLQSVLRNSADEACKKDKLSPEKRNQYFISVTECEIQDGILKAKDVNDHCLVYKRELCDLKGPALNDENASRFIDIKKSDKGIEIDMEVHNLREALTTKKIPNKLDKKSIRTYSVPWRPGGIDPETDKDHSIYIKEFCIDFISDCLGLIERELTQRENLIPTANYYSDYEESIHHLKFCQSKCESFCGQEKVLDEAKAYILDESARKPLVIHAQSGAGKTSIMAMIMKSVPKWLKSKSHIKLIRFLGTTPNSNRIYDVLFSVLGQLSDACDMIMSPISYRNVKNLIDYVPRYLRQVAQTCKEPIIILLDSVDQLYPDHNAYAMEWLPLRLPQNVKLILSTLPQEHGILENLQKRLPPKECYVEVPLLPESTGKLIAESYLKGNNRTLTEAQMRLVLSVFKNSPSPLFLKLLLDEARKWHSYTQLSELLLASTVKEAINKLFENLEKKFGYALICHALGYITIGLTGLTEFEIEDVLSCDDVVLNEVYKYHDPPVPGIVRIPPVLWARIRYDIREYLVERISQGKNTLNWYHRQFIEVARQKYATSELKVIGLHKNLVDIYLQDCGVKRTITLTNRNNLTITDADRQVTPQPFTTQNRRKLACLPYHVIRTGRAISNDDKKEKIFCNFKFLCTKIAAFSPSAVISDLEDFIQTNEDEEILLLLNFMSTSKADLTSPVRLAVCLLAYINPEENHMTLISLLEQAKQYLLSQKKTNLVPTFPCLTSRTNVSSALQTLLHGFSAIRATSNNLVLLKYHKQCDESDDKSDYAIFNLSNMDLQQFDLLHPLKYVALPNYAVTGTHVYYVTNSDLVAYDYNNGKSVSCSFSDMLPKWDANTNSVNYFTSNAENTLGILTFKNSSRSVLIDLQHMKLVQSFNIARQFATVEKTVFVNSEVEAKVVSVGKITNSSPDDVPQGPDNMWFVCLFETGKENPVKFLEVEKEIDIDVMALANQDNWLVIATKGTKEQDSDKIDNQDTHVDDTKETGSGDGTNVQLLSFRLDDVTKESEISLSGPVVKLQGSPLSKFAAALTADGTFRLVDLSKGSIKMEVKLNYPIRNVCVVWEESICLLCSAAGNVTLYDIEEDKNLGAFTAHKNHILDITLSDQQCVTLDSSHELKAWSVTALINETKMEEMVKKSKQAVSKLLDETNVSALGVSIDGTETITCTEDGYIKMWDTESQKLLRQYNIEIIVNVILVLSDGSVALLDKKLGKLLIFDIESGKYVIKMSDFPENVLAITRNSEKNTVYAVSSPRQGHQQIDIVNIELKKISKTISIQKGLTYHSLDVMLSKMERYLVIRSLIPDEEYEGIQQVTKKAGSFGEQPHHHKFTAIDILHGNGGLMPCFRQLTKIPTLGTVMEPYRGNTMLVATRRYVLFWEIPTGACSQKTNHSSSDNNKNCMLYRPAWVGKRVKGQTSVLRLSPSNEFVAIGSEDGYVIIYDMEKGTPRNLTKPATYHTSEGLTDLILETWGIVIDSILQADRWLVFWDIPTGKCDQKLSKKKKVGMFYRPGWLGQNCKGTSLAVEKSPNEEYLAVGSEDGYLFIYDTEYGLPRNNAIPSTRHNTEVQKVAISPDSKWVVSSCLSSILKLWEARTGKEQFSIRVDAEVQSIMFTPDSQHLVLYTGIQTTRVIMFSVHDGQPSDSPD